MQIPLRLPYSIRSWPVGNPNPLTTGNEPATIAGKLARARTALFSLAFVSALALPFPSSATVFAPGFVGPSLDRGLVAAGSRGTSFTVGGGTLMLDQANGQGNGGISVMSARSVSGDFVATVTASGIGLGRADLGLVLGTADWTYTLADVFLNDLAGTVNGNIFQPIFAGAFLPKFTEAATLTISRSGDTIRDVFDAGTKPIVINSGSDPALNGPVNIGLFLLEAAGDTGAHHGTFTHFQLMSGADDRPTPVSEPSTVALVASGILALYGLNIVRRWTGRKKISAPCATNGST